MRLAADNEDSRETSESLTAYYVGSSTGIADWVEDRREANAVDGLTLTTDRRSGLALISIEARESLVIAASALSG